MCVVRVCVRVRLQLWFPAPVASLSRFACVCLLPPLPVCAADSVLLRACVRACVRVCARLILFCCVRACVRVCARLQLAGILHDCVNVFSCTPASRLDLPVYFFCRFLFSRKCVATLRVVAPELRQVFTRERDSKCSYEACTTWFRVPCVRWLVALTVGAFCVCDPACDPAGTWTGSAPPSP